MENFATIFNGFNSLTIFVKLSILRVCWSPRHVFETPRKNSWIYSNTLGFLFLGRVFFCSKDAGYRHYGSTALQLKAPLWTLFFEFFKFSLDLTVMNFSVKSAERVIAASFQAPEILFINFEPFLFFHLEKSKASRVAPVLAHEQAVDGKTGYWQ